MSDVPTSLSHQYNKLSMESGQDKGKSLMQSTHETVAKALGGGSRGRIAFFLIDVLFLTGQGPINERTVGSWVITYS